MSFLASSSEDVRLRSRLRFLIFRSRDQRGAEIAEAAFVLPLLFMFLLAIFWFGRAFSVHGTINHAAREGAKMAATPSCANCSAGSAPCNGSGWAGTSFPCDQAVVNSITNVLNVAHIDASQAQALPPTSQPVPCPGLDPPGKCESFTDPNSGGTFTICRNMLVSPQSTFLQNAAACGAIVSFQYPYSFVLPFASISKQTFSLTAQASVEGEN